MKKLPFSVCIITKNNAKTLERCLQSASNYFDEIVITDTGSSDSTKEIARFYTNQIFDFTWNNNFADARNFAIKKATNDFIFSLDSDEEISKINCRQLLDFSKNTWKISAESKFWIFKAIIPLKRDTFQESSIANFFNLKDQSMNSSFQSFIMAMQMKISIKKSSDISRNDWKKLKETPDDSYLLYQLGRTYDIQKDFVNASEAYLKSLQTSPGMILNIFGLHLTIYVLTIST